MTETTRAETRVADALPRMDQADSSAITVVGLLGAAVAAIFHFRRKASRDSTEIVKDRVEGQLIQDMMKDREGVLKERDAARISEREAWTKANECAVLNAKLRSDNEYMQREITRLTQTVAELQTTIDQVRKRLTQLSNGATGYTDFDQA